MGVKDLWTILEPVKEHKRLTELQGQVIAVDLSIWIVEARTLQLKGVTKPHLRNLFFRVSSLLQLNIIPVIVIEGEPPDLKQQVMKKRIAQQYPPRGVPHNGVRHNAQKVRRRNFTADHKECCEMLDYLGVSYVQSAGEAEAMCAFLNKNHVVDGCITNDGDAFLYGATTVYRNFTANSKDPHVESYTMSNISEKLHLDRERLVALAVLLGCDYLPRGVPNVGRDLAMKFISSLSAVDSVLKRFHQWNDATFLHYCKPGSAELQVWKKSVLCAGFPYQDVIDEFLIDKDKFPHHPLVWKRPKMFHLMTFAKSKMEWPEEYGIEKVLPLVSLYDINRLAGSRPHAVTGSHLKPCRIVKARVRHGVPCWEIEWHKIAGDTITKTDYYTTVEEQQSFCKAFPEMAAMFQQVTQGKEKQKRKKKGATYGGCNLLGELAESRNTGVDNSEAREGQENDIDKLETGNEPSKSSLCRSLSLVMLSELIASVTLGDSISDNRATYDGQHTSPISCSSSREQHSVDIDSQQEHSLGISNADFSFTEIPPLSQRLGLHHCCSDSVSTAQLPAAKLPLCSSVVDSKSEKSKNGYLKRSSQKTVSSDSAMLCSRRRERLILRANSIFSNDSFFLETAKPSDVKTEQHKACSSESTENEENTLDSSSTSDTEDVFLFNRLDSKHTTSVSESDFVQKFQSSLCITNKFEYLESASANKSSIPDQCQVTECSDKVSDPDYCDEVEATESSIDRPTDRSAVISSQQLTGPLIWSPRHCGKFCIETSIITSPSVDDSDSCENALRDHKLSLRDVNNLNSGSITSFDPGNTDNERTDNVDSTYVSELLFDDSVSPEELVLPQDISNEHCDSVTKDGDSHCNEGDCSVIMID